jgi:hypothetical protein
MAKVYDVNRIATYGGSTAMFYIKETLKNCGWVVSGSSDGITYFSASDGITTDGPGAGGMNNNRAWFWIVDPANRRGFTAARSGSSILDDHGKYWQITWSEMAFSSSLTGTVNNPITFANEGKPSPLHGSGSAVAPSGAPLFPVSESFRCHITSYNTPHNTVYGFYSFCSALGTSTGKTSTIFACDPILSGSISSLDQAPYVIKTIHSVTDTNWLNTVASSIYNKTLNCPFGNSVALPFWGSTLTYYRFGMSGSSAQATFTTTYPGFSGYDVNGTEVRGAAGVTNGYMYTMGFDLFDGAEKEILLPWMWVGGQLTATAFANKYRGYAARFRIHSNSTFNGVGRKYPDTINLTTDAYICVGAGMVMPWPENISGMA